MHFTAAARLVFMIGDPVAHTSLPDAFNARAAAAGEDVAMVPLQVPPAGLADAIGMLRASGNALGAVVTAPHKQAVGPMLDDIADRARRIGAVNVIRRDETGRLTGENTDGEGFLAAARARGFAPAGARVLLFGCGGAGTAIAVALAEAGAHRIALVDPDAARRRAAQAAAGRVAVPAAPDIPLGGFAMVVNATDIGRDGTAAVRGLRGIDPGTLVADVISAPGLTPWLAEARRLGCPIQTGAEMAAAQLGPVRRLLGLAER